MQIVSRNIIYRSTKKNLFYSIVESTNIGYQRLIWIEDCSESCGGKGAMGVWDEKLSNPYHILELMEVSIHKRRGNFITRDAYVFPLF